MSDFAIVKLLHKGYVMGRLDKLKVAPTISLIIDDDIIAVVDPGTLKDSNILINALSNESLDADDVNTVFLTHSHLDHYRNIGLFRRARIIDYWGAWYGDELKGINRRISKNIELVHTPGHSTDGITIFVRSKDGIIAICGDVIWSKSMKPDPYAVDRHELEKSRQFILSRADYIIPGHGDMFRVEK